MALYHNQANLSYSSAARFHRIICTGIKRAIWRDLQVCRMRIRNCNRAVSTACRRRTTTSTRTGCPPDGSRSYCTTRYQITGGAVCGPYRITVRDAAFVG